LKVAQFSTAPPGVAISMGDPAGIGAEVILKAARALRARRGAPRLLVVGDLGAMRAAAERLGDVPPPIAWRKDEPLPELERGLAVVSRSKLSARARRPGKPTVEGGAASFDYVVDAARMAMRDEVDAIVTAPISKEWWNRAGHHYPGHSELLASLAKARRWRMMFAGDLLRVALVTVHMGLAKVPAALTETSIADTIRLLAEHLRRIHGMTRPRIGVLGLNPHAGEHGLFGTEEKRLIEPAIRRARRDKIAAFGPLAPDTAFIRQGGEFKFDAAVAMYHDQGLIALKTLEFDRAVNVTLGLPFIRTSPDHGTAFEIAGQGAADHSSLLAAIEYAWRAALNGRAKRAA
jgi:4-phospho-D-threonate 3-dehydrogenase / 4-phospho-D-erythronate 3-dehydrogenase